MKQICFILAVVTLAIHVPGCSTAIEEQSPTASGDASSTKTDRPSNPDVKPAQAKPDPALPVAFVGKFDPFAAYDKNIKDRIVMVKRPDCGSCHAKALLTGRKLHLVVNHVKKDDEWTIQGRPEGKTMVFEKPKIRIVLKDGKLSGKFTGKMHANIQLAAAPNEKNGQ